MDDPTVEERATLLQSLFGDDDSDSDDASRSSGIAEKSETRIPPPPPPRLLCRNERTDETVNANAKTAEPGVEDRSREQWNDRKKRKSCWLAPTPLPQRQSKENNNTTASTETTSSLLWSQKIGIFDGVLTPDECDELIAVQASESHHGYIDHLEVTRVSDLVLGGNNNSNQDDDDDKSCEPSSSLPLVLPLLRARYKIWEIVETFFPEARMEVFPEYTALTAWHSGAFLRMHYDANKEYLTDRHFSAILYLNDPLDDSSGNHSKPQQQHPDDYHRSAFAGGDLVFEVPSVANTNTNANTNANNKAGRTAIRPRAGRLVCFPSSSGYVHGVEPITEGTRYALTMWFTKHQDAMESLGSLKHEYLLGRTTTKTKHKNRSRMPLLSLQENQPWETPEQAIALRQKTLRRAGLPKQPQQQDQDETNFLPAPSDSFETSEAELLHLIAHCWWKKGVPLGTFLVSGTPTKQAATASESRSKPWTLRGNSEFFGLANDWNTGYLLKRSRGLESALERWMNDEGMLITSVRDDEMK